jgi:hypothetical protein
MGKDTKTAARRAGLLAVAAGLGLALSAAARRRAGAQRRTDDTYRCTCGAEYRVRGADRHRIYFRGDEPVLGDRCAECDAPLPAGHDGAVV